MSLPARLRSALRNWPPLRRRTLAALLTTGLLATAFYGTESLRGSLAVASAMEEAQRAGVPVSLGEVFARKPPAERNLFLAPVLKSRIVGAAEPALSARFLKANVPWGAIHPRSGGKGTKRYPVKTSPTDGRRMDFAAVQEAMAILSWALPEKGTPAEKVRGGLDRFQTELEEWTVEIRKRPEWGMPAEEAADFQVYEKALEEVVDILGLRAVAGAEAGRDGVEIWRDLESVSLLSRHLWNRIRTVNTLLWEVLASRCLKDAEWRPPVAC
ncbi:MAG: hypothetical protein EOP86_17185 [Verrucomicrobiaceae bacterium]|nr:MAG: hypothetical protein EOP86_17185 [Verrucomicrobiaceae bacterium]